MPSRRRATVRALAVPLACATILASASVRAQDLAIPKAVYPTLPARAGSPDGLVPPGWIIEAKSEIDLNRDGVPDVVLVLHQTSPENVVSNPGGMGEKSLDTNPRMLVVAFAEQTGVGYKRVVADHTIIPRWENPVLEDPFGELTTARGAFSIRFTFFAYAGAWEAISVNLTFRYQDGGFELIGADRDTTDRASGRTRGISANYSTGTIAFTTGTISSDHDKLTRRRLTKPKRLRIEQVGDGLRFEPR